MSSYEERFDAGIAHLHRYVAAHGSSSPPHGSMIDGFLIGSWVGSRRTEYRRGRLSAERIELFEREFSDWQWTPQTAVFAAGFETGIEHLHRYVAVYGTANACRRDLINGFSIGTWVQSRRADYRRGRLSAGWRSAGRRLWRHTMRDQPVK